jgi:hypothetical protein
MIASECGAPTCGPGFSASSQPTRVPARLSHLRGALSLDRHGVSGGPLNVLAWRGRSPCERQLPHTGRVARRPVRRGKRGSTCPKKRPQSVSLTRAEKCGAKGRFPVWFAENAAGLVRIGMETGPTTLLTRTVRFSRLKAWGLRLAKRCGLKEGAGRRGAQACSETPRDVEDEHGVPLERKRSMSNMFS